MNSKQLNLLLAILIVVLAGALVYITVGNKADKRLTPNNDVANMNSIASNSNSSENAKPLNPAPSNEPEVYTSTKYGFSVELPADWVANENTSGIQFISKTDLEAQNKNLEICNNNRPGCIPEFFTRSVSFHPQSTLSQANPGSVTKETVNGVVFSKYTASGLTDFYYYETSRSQRGYSFNSVYEPSLEKIVKTFKFIK